MLKLTRKKFYVATAITGCAIITGGAVMLSGPSSQSSASSEDAKSPPRAKAPTASPVLAAPPEAAQQASNAATAKLAPKPKSAAAVSSYPIHSGIKGTVFWAGETASADNAYITNTVSAWDNNWQDSFGGYDDPLNRNGYLPGAFTPRENPFYVALPYGDYTETGIKPNISQIYWYSTPAPGTSLLKNRWVKVTAGGKTVYGQWEDVGPFESDDVNYVFGSAKPRQPVGIDLSPAIATYLGFEGSTTVSWQFVDAPNVPSGPWKQIITSSPPRW